MEEEEKKKQPSPNVAVFALYLHHMAPFQNPTVGPLHHKEDEFRLPVKLKLRLVQKLGQTLLEQKKRWWNKTELGIELGMGQ